jgi:phosphate transport system substrate-binding protein
MIQFPTVRALGLCAAAALFATTARAEAVKVDPKIESYTPVAGVSGNVKSIGSDSMLSLMTLWLEGFTKQYPAVTKEVEGKGSGTAPPALIAGTATFGPMSRTMKQQEIDDFEKAFGYKPVALQTSIDVLAVYVHKDNPIARTGLTLPQVDAIFSSSRKGGAKADVKTWGQLGLPAPWASLPVSLYGRNSASGTYGYFKEHALFKGDFKPTVKEQPGSSSVVQGVASDKAGIGYSGIGYMTADVAAVPLAAKDGAPFVPASADRAGDYPLARFLMIYVNKKPNEPLDPLRREFIKLIFSKDGQEVVVKDGYIPVSYAIAKKTLADVGIDIDSDYK